MKTLFSLCLVVLTIIVPLISPVFAHGGAVALVFLRPDKTFYFPGDLAVIRGQTYTNDTKMTIELVKNHELMVQSKEVPVEKNGTFVANFTIPEDSAKSWSLVDGSLMQDLYFKPSPLDQFKAGVIAKNVRCNEDLQLVIKLEDSSPACVKPDTAQKLVERGWGGLPLGGLPIPSRPSHYAIPVMINGIISDHSFNYTITNGQIEQAKADVANKELILSINSTGNGMLGIDLPRTLIDSKINGQDAAFIVLEDKTQVLFNQTTTSQSRILSIPFQYGVSQIEIIAPGQVQ